MVSPVFELALEYLSTVRPCTMLHGQGHLPLDQAAQSPIQPGLEHFQGGGIHSFSGQPVPVPQNPHRKNFFLISSLNLVSFHLKLLPLVQSLQALVKSFSIFLISPLYRLKGCNKVFLKPLLLQAEHPQLSQPFFIGEVFQPLFHVKIHSIRKLYFSSLCS